MLLSVVWASNMENLTLVEPAFTARTISRTRCRAGVRCFLLVVASLKHDQLVEPIDEIRQREAIARQSKVTVKRSGLVDATGICVGEDNLANE